MHERQKPCRAPLPPRSGTGMRAQETAAQGWLRLLSSISNQWTQLSWRDFLSQLAVRRNHMRAADVLIEIKLRRGSRDKNRQERSRADSCASACSGAVQKIPKNETLLALSDCANMSMPSSLLTYASARARSLIQIKQAQLPVRRDRQMAVLNCAARGRR